MSIRKYFNIRIGLTVVGVVLFASTFPGCGEKKVAVNPVRGKVIFQGQAAEGAQVVLHPVNTTANNVIATGNVNSDGSFTLGVYDNEDGAPPGDYIATVQWFRFVTDEGSSGKGPNVLPDKYAHAETSPLRVTVKPGNNELPPFDVTN